jgi:3-dehydroquinate synthase
MMNDTLQQLSVTLRRTVDDSYPIFIGDGLFSRLGSLLRDRGLPKRVALVSDTSVFALHGPALRDALAAAGFAVAVEAVFPAGEEHKTRETKAWIEDRLLETKLGRDTWVAALGGGVVGDMAGYTAATYLRGIPFVQFPTTLLAMVDSSVGGKTGLDTPHGKNLIGAFWQPRAVIADLRMLATLPPVQVQAGLAEVIKHAVIADPEFFDYLQAVWPQVARLDPAVMGKIVHRNCAIKAGVVEKDERESDLRKILNFGHTLGHALETAADYRLLHGTCVAIGMRYEAELAAALGLLAASDVKRIQALLDQAGFPAVDDVEVSAAQLVELTKSDKKARGGHVEYVFPKQIGAMAQGERGYGIRVGDEQALPLLERIRGR